MVILFPHFTVAVAVVTRVAVTVAVAVILVVIVAVAVAVCLFFIYLFEQVEVLAAIQLMWTCYTHPYTHRGQPQHRELHPLLFSNSVWVL